MNAEPTWLTRQIVDALHGQELIRRGGLPGLRDEGALESALARPRQKQAYGEPDLFDLAASYGFGLARNHAYSDGNKRIAFVALNVFLELNGFMLHVPEPEAVITMLAVAAGDRTEDDLAAWCREHSAPIDPA